MTDTRQIQSTFQCYTQLIEKLLHPSIDVSPRAESGFAIQIERGTMLSYALASQNPPHDLVERLILVASTDRLRELVVVDRLGHQRPVYRPLLIYSWLLTFQMRYEQLPRETFGRWDEALRSWCDLLESGIGSIEGTSAPQTAETAWAALALQVAGHIFIRDAWTDLAADTFGRLSRLQQPSGAFLAVSASQNPETHWYNDLAILHAAASYAVQSEDRIVARAVERATTFHLAETQPDHATTQPWGLFAFIWNESTRPLADHLLHTVALSASSPSSSASPSPGTPLPPSPGTPREGWGEGDSTVRHSLDAVSLILLADSLYSLRLFL